MQQVFKPTLNCWFTKAGQPLIFAAATLVSIQYIDAYGLYIFFALFVFDAAKNIWRLSRCRLVVDDEKIEGHFVSSSFNIRWRDVIAASFDAEAKESWLSLGTAHKDVFTVPLQLFDAPEVWKQVQSHVSQQALEPDAYKRLPGYEESILEEKKAIKELRPAIVVKDGLFLKLIGWVCLVMFGACAFFSWRAGKELWLPILFLVFAALGAYILLSIGQLELSSKTIVRRSPLSHHEIGWHEVRRIEMGKQGDAIIFSNEEKRLVAMGTAYWSKENTAEAIRFIGVQAAERKIEFITTASAAYKLSKNTKVKRR